MSSIRYRTSKAGLGEVPVPSKRMERGARTSTVEGRRTLRHRFMTTMLDMREQQQAEKGLQEFPHELINNATGEVIKKNFMADSEAMKRNISIRDLGMTWRRCGY